MRCLVRSMPVGGRDEAVGVRLRDDLLEADERAAADEQHVRRVDVAAVPQLDRRALHDLEQRVLHAFAGAAAAAPSRGAFSLSISSMKTMPRWARSMSPSALSTSRCRIASISSLTKRGLRERRRLGGHERHAEDARQRLAQQRLAGAGVDRSAGCCSWRSTRCAPRRGDLLEVRVDGDGDDALRVVLADHVVVEMLDQDARREAGRQQVQRFRLIVHGGLSRSQRKTAWGTPRRRCHRRSARSERRQREVEEDRAAGRLHLAEQRVAVDVPDQRAREAGDVRAPR